jgi:hypothetical protein
MAAEHEFLAEGTTCRRCGVYFDNAEASKPCPKDRSDSERRLRRVAALVFLAFAILFGVGLVLMPLLGNERIAEEARTPADQAGQRVR